MIEIDGDSYYVFVDGVRLKGPFNSRDEAVEAEEEVRYHMRVSAYKVERGQE